jgi:hypothetical protein
MRQHPQKQGETAMFRKITLALAAATVVTTAAIPTAASAHWTGWRHHHHRHGVVVRVITPAYGYAPHYAYAPRCYTTKRFVRSHWGWRKVIVRHCR